MVLCYLLFGVVPASCHTLTKLNNKGRTTYYTKYVYSFHELNYTTRALLGATFWWFCPVYEVIFRHHTTYYTKWVYSFHEVNYTTRTLLGATFWWFCPACQININLRIYKCFVLTLCGYVYIYYIHEYLHAAYSHYIRRVYITCIVVTLNIAYLHYMHRNYNPCSVFT